MIRITDFYRIKTAKRDQLAIFIDLDPEDNLKIGQKIRIVNPDETSVSTFIDGFEVFSLVDGTHRYAIHSKTLTEKDLKINAEIFDHGT